MRAAVTRKEMVEEAAFLLSKYGVRERNAAMDARRRAQEELAKTAFVNYMGTNSELGAQWEGVAQWEAVARWEDDWLSCLENFSSHPLEFRYFMHYDDFTLWPLDECLFLRFLAANFIEHDEPMPDRLRLWIITELKSPHANPRSRSGAPRHGERKNTFRDAAILGTVNAISLKYKINPTRNRESNADSVSASQVVAEALGHLRVNVNALAIEKIWNNRPLRKMDWPPTEHDSLTLGSWGRNPRTKRR
jgi:hypothetical protein